MKNLTAFFTVYLLLCLTACSSPPPDFTGEWEQVTEEISSKRFLTITFEDQKYYVIDEIKNPDSGEVSYDENSSGVLDGNHLLTGTNLLTNVLSLNEKTESLTMKTYDKNTLTFKKIR